LGGADKYVLRLAGWPVAASAFVREVEVEREGGREGERERERKKDEGAGSGRALD
jgi:hypothetical protein